VSSIVNDKKRDNAVLRSLH